MKIKRLLRKESAISDIAVITILMLSGVVVSTFAYFGYKTVINRTNNNTIKTVTNQGIYINKDYNADDETISGGTGELPDDLNSTPEVEKPEDDEAEKIIFEITYNANGGKFTNDSLTNKVQYANYVAVSGMLRTPVNSGWIFGGWYTTPDYKDGEELDILAITEDTEVFARWRKNQYVVNFDANGGTGTMEDQTFTLTSKAFLNKNTFKRSGYTFIGWSLSANSSEVAFRDREFVGGLTTEEEITLYAVWSAGEVIVTFESGYADVIPSPRVKAVTYGKEYGEMPTVVIDGYEFIGWFTQQEGGTQVYQSTQVSNNSNHTLYAHWKPADLDFLLMFEGSGTSNFTTFAKHDYVLNDSVTYTGSPAQGYWESFSIRLSNLEVGGKYRLKFDAAFSDRTCIRDETSYPIGCRVDDIMSFAQSGSTETYDWNPTDKDKSVKGFVIEFVATKDAMYWLWELSKTRNPGETWKEWKPGVENYEEGYFDLTISNVSLTLEGYAEPDIQFEKTAAPPANVVAFTLNESSDDRVHFNLTGGSGKYEKVNIPIDGLIPGKEYTVDFTLATNGQGNAGTYHFGTLIASQPSTTNNAQLGSDAIRVWNGDTFIKPSGNKSVTKTFTFTATSYTMYWIWDMQCIANNGNFFYDITATIK